MSRVAFFPNADDLCGLFPPVAGYDKHGPFFKKQDVIACCEKMVSVGNYFNKQAKNMTKDAEKAIELTQEVTDSFGQALSRMMKIEHEFVDQSKKAAGSVRDAAEKLSQGLARVEKAANFERLERYVELLERAAAAMTMLAELEKAGKLEKIASAIR